MSGCGGGGAAPRSRLQLAAVVAGDDDDAAAAAVVDDDDDESGGAAAVAAAAAFNVEAMVELEDILRLVYGGWCGVLCVFGRTHDATKRGGLIYNTEHFTPARRGGLRDSARHFVLFGSDSDSLSLSVWAGGENNANSRAARV